MRTSARIALIHAVQVAIQPVEDAFVKLWPEARRINLFDDSLSPDRERDGELTEAMTKRIHALADYALQAGANGVLYTCSAFGEAIEAAKKKHAAPILKPNEAMFEEALTYGARVGMLATFEPSVASMQVEFEAAARAQGRRVDLQTICIPEAMAALKGGDEAKHSRLLADAALRLTGCDALMLAHFSTSRAAAAVAEMANCPVLTSPGSAVLRLRRAIEHARSPALEH